MGSSELRMGLRTLTQPILQASQSRLAFHIEYPGLSQSLRTPGRLTAEAECAGDVPAEAMYERLIAREDSGLPRAADYDLAGRVVDVTTGLVRWFDRLLRNACTGVHG